MKNLLIASLMFLVGANTFAGTLNQLVNADCSAEDGSYFRLDRQKTTLETRFADLPDMINLSDGQRMPIETEEREEHMGIGAFVTNFEMGIWGSASLFAEKEKTLTENEALLAVYRDMLGNVSTATLNCILEFK